MSEVRIENPLIDAFIDAAQDVGIPNNDDLNGASQEGVGRCQASQAAGFPVYHRGGLRVAESRA